jgi:YidC/Oxa1 family membrane protein insertase
MEKRVFIAVLLSFVFLFLWASLAGIFFPDLKKDRAKAPVKPASATVAEAPKGATAAPSPTSATASAASAPAVAKDELPGPARPAVAPIAAAAAKIVTVDTPLYVATFTNRGAELTSFRLKEYTEKNGQTVDLVRKRPGESEDYPFAIESGDARLTSIANSALYAVEDQERQGRRVVSFRYVDSSGFGISKTFSFDDDYSFDVTVQTSGTRAPYRLIIGPGIKTPNPGDKLNRFTTTGNGLIQEQGSLKVIAREKLSGLHSSEAPPEFVGIDDNYFLLALKPQKSGTAVLRSIEFPKEKGEDKPQRELYAGLNADGSVVSAQAFFGPKDVQLLEKNGLEKAAQFGYFGFIARILLFALVWVNTTLTHNYGWAIVVLTIIIKVLLYPLQHKSIVSMKKMQKLQPKVNSLKEKYKKAKTDPEQRQMLNTEMMKLYQQEGVSPASGCLPIALQIPILWAFYGLLAHAIELRHAPFMLWIHDLSDKDPYFITPALMTITMVIQQQLTPSTADPVQKKMFLMMPLVFGFLFKDFPSGLVVYWLVQNILTIVQQLIMNRYWKEHPLTVSISKQGAR